MATTKNRWRVFAETYDGRTIHLGYYPTWKAADIAADGDFWNHKDANDFKHVRVREVKSAKKKAKKKVAKRRTKKTYAALTARQLDTLKRYQKWAGSDWKTKLRRDWMRAGSEWHGEFAPLMQLRNNQGPAWLAQYKGGTVKKKKTEKVCAMSGYGFVLDGDASKWRSASDERWDIELIDGGPVTLLGKRRIDGTEVCVFKKGRKVMAQSCINVTKC